MKHWLACAALALGASPLAAADPVDGRWLTGDEGAVVEIAPCGNSTCGRIVRFIKAPPQGADQRDVNNSDRAKRTRKLLGLAILTGFTQDGNVWKGTIYDPKNGKSYRSVIRLLGKNRLEVKGCLGPFCRSQEWSRAR